MSLDRFAIGYALGFARTAHTYVTKSGKPQMYGENRPYVTHLLDVVTILRDHGSTETETMLAGILHDIVEDTLVPLSEIELMFGPIVADTVDRVSDREGANRRARHEATYPLTRQSQRAILVKLADRLANWQTGLKSKMYRAEYPFFKDSLHIPNSPEPIPTLWSKLDDLFALDGTTEAV